MPAQARSSPHKPATGLPNSTTPATRLASDDQKKLERVVAPANGADVSLGDRIRTRDDELDCRSGTDWSRSVIGGTSSASNADGPWEKPGRIFILQQRPTRLRHDRPKSHDGSPILALSEYFRAP